MYIIKLHYINLIVCSIVNSRLKWNGLGVA